MAENSRRVSMKMMIIVKYVVFCSTGCYKKKKEEENEVIKTPALVDNMLERREATLRGTRNGKTLIKQSGYKNKT